MSLSEKSQDYSRQIELYKELQDSLHLIANEYRRNGLKETDVEILELQNKWREYADKINEIKYKLAFKDFDEANKQSSISINEIDRSLSELATTDVDDKITLITAKIQEQELMTSRIIPQLDVLRKLYVEGAIDSSQFADETDKLNQLLFETSRSIRENSASLKTLKFDTSMGISKDTIQDIDFQIQLLSTSNADAQKKIEAVTNQLEIENKIIDINAQKLRTIEDLKKSGVINSAEYEQSIKDTTKAWQDAVLAADKLGKEISNIQLAQVSANESAINKIVELTKNLIKQEISINVGNLNDEIKAIDNLKKALNDLEKDYNKNLKNRRDADKERKKALDDEIKAAKKLADQRKKDLQDELKIQKELADEAKKRIQDELDGYKAIIDATKKSLEQESDARYYEQDLAEKQKAIADIRDRLSELQFNESIEARKERFELEEELAKKQLDLDNFLYDHSKKIQLNALDEEWERYSKLKDDEKDAIDDNLKAYEDSIEAQIDAIEKQLEAQQEAHDATIDMIDAELEAYEKMIEQEIDALKRRGEEYDTQAEDIKKR